MHAISGACMSVLMCVQTLLDKRLSQCDMAVTVASTAIVSCNVETAFSPTISTNLCWSDNAGYYYLCRKAVFLLFCSI